MKTTTFYPTGVCSKLIEIESDNETIVDVKFHGGCNGNLQGISKLVKGQNMKNVVATLKEINCNGRGTSCPDQLATALEEIIKNA